MANLTQPVVPTPSQADQAEHSAVAPAHPAKLAPKQAGGSTWAWGSAETVAVVLVMVAGYRVSGNLARRRTADAATAAAPPAAAATPVQL